MALRILTGQIAPKKRDGKVIINFNPLTVLSATNDGEGTELVETGASGDFIDNQDPGKIISLREIEFEDKDTFFGGKEKEWFRIHDDNLDSKKVEVYWKCQKGAMIKEISFMIVGEVRD